MFLRACYALPGTDVWDAPTHFFGTDGWYAPTRLLRRARCTDVVRAVLRVLPGWFHILSAQALVLSPDHKVVPP
eukprot:3314838-Rhodomonas_salina.2